MSLFLGGSVVIRVCPNLRSVACLCGKSQFFVLVDISDHARVLHKLYDELSSKIDAQTVADHMFQQNELTQRDLENIQSKRSEPIAAAKQLLNIITEQPRSVYWCFLDSLTKAKQEHLRKIILFESLEGQLNVTYSSLQ